MSAPENRPWPVVLLTALGAWLAAIPLLIAVGGLLGDTLRHGAGPYIVGTLVLAAAITVLRSQALPLFVEQLAIPALLVGGGTLSIGVMADLSQTAGALVLLAVTLALAAALPQSWLRILLGALAAGLLTVALVPESTWSGGLTPVLWALHALLAVWLLATHAPRLGVALKNLLTPLSQGWLLAMLAALSWLGGPSFLVMGAAGSNEWGQLAGDLSHRTHTDWAAQVLHGLSAALVLVSAVWGARAWPVLRTPLAVAVALTLAVLAWAMPALGAVLLALMVTALTHRWLVCAACALAAAWVVGAFYYQLQWPLADKALLLAGSGAVLGAAAWLVQRGQNPAASDAKTAAAKPWGQGGATSAWAILGSVALSLLVVNGAIWQKEDLIAHGTPLYLPLAPVDPRSLMQGDYMRLRFAALDDSSLPLLADLGGQRPHLVVARDLRHVGRVLRLHKAADPLAADEMLLELTPKDGRWVVVTDAWFFKEGDAKIWQAAKFGEFRVLPSGRALLVGMADANLQAIGSPTQP